MLLNQRIHIHIRLRAHPKIQMPVLGHDPPAIQVRAKPIPHQIIRQARGFGRKHDIGAPTDKLNRQAPQALNPLFRHHIPAVAIQHNVGVLVARRGLRLDGRARAGHEVRQQAHVDAADEVGELRVRRVGEVGVDPEAAEDKGEAVADGAVAALTGGADGVEAQRLVEELLEQGRRGGRDGFVEGVAG